MLKNPVTHYFPFTTVRVPESTGTSKTVTPALVWLSANLQDSNQALIEPLNDTRKLHLFDLLVGIGFKAIFHRVSFRFTNRPRLCSLQI